MGYTFEARYLSEFEIFCFRVIERETTKLRNNSNKGDEDGERR